MSGETPQGDKLNASRGYAGDLAEHIGRICECLGITIVLQKPDNSKNEWANGYKYRSMNVGQAVGLIRHTMREIKDHAKT